MKASDFVARERLGSIAAVEAMAATAHACYLAALKHDGMPPGTKFAVFSPDNPYVTFYERALQQYREAATACASHGYCGLSMEHRELFRPKRAPHVDSSRRRDVRTAQSRAREAQDREAFDA
jgi:hypothetical protein